jgi:hypothetical protein
LTYYHLRYNIYPPPGFPIEKEEWLCLPKKHNEQEIKRKLISRHDTKVTLICFTAVCKEDYESRIAKTSSRLSGNAESTDKNLAEWRLDRSARMLKKLNDDSDTNDERYRNIGKPPPLL